MSNFANLSAILKCAKCILLLALCLVATPAVSSPVLVNTSTGWFAVDVLPLDSFDDLQDTLDDQVWWGDEALAREFAEAVGDALGLVNFPSSTPPNLGPLFATGGPNSGGNSVGCYWVSAAGTVSCYAFAPTSTDVYHAVATPVLTAPAFVSTSAGRFAVDVLPLDSFDDLRDILDDQVWWGDEALAREFAEAVGDALGLVNFPSSTPPNLGPLFATGGPNSGGNSVGCYWVSAAGTVTCNPFAPTTTPIYHAFAVKLYTVSAITDSGGSISPASVEVLDGKTASFTVTPEHGFSASVTGCNGTLNGSIYTTAPITADCTVTAQFKHRAGSSVPVPTMSATILSLLIGLLLILGCHGVWQRRREG